VTYDEEGGFFDHKVPPTPATSDEVGASTVDTVNEGYPGSPPFQAGPYGLGLRVPMIVVSPWSRGGFVNSQLFDHTSLIRFLEARFADHNPDLVESNITPWRRAVVGDLTSAFDFRDPNTKRPRLPDTSSFAPPNTDRYPDFDVVAPTGPQMPGQERGVRPARALPYSLQANATVAGDGAVRLDFRNSGRQTAVFQVWSAEPTDAPRTYTVEPGKRLDGSWPASAGDYELSVHGPNGFLRRFQGGGAADRARLDVSADDHGDDLRLTITNPTNRRVSVRVTDGYSGHGSDRQLQQGASWSTTWSTGKLFGWYDLTVQVASDAGFAYRLAGHVEDGRDSASDPGMGGLGGHHP
jgi:phospholipase C